MKNGDSLQKQCLWKEVLKDNMKLKRSSLNAVTTGKVNSLIRDYLNVHIWH